VCVCVCVCVRLRVSVCMYAELSTAREHGVDTCGIRLMPVCPHVLAHFWMMVQVRYEPRCEESSIHMTVPQIFAKFLREEWDGPVLAAFLQASQMMGERATVPCIDYPPDYAPRYACPTIRLTLSRFPLKYKPPSGVSLLVTVHQRDISGPSLAFLTSKHGL
jgi:hypothetical protein